MPKFSYFPCDDEEYYGNCNSVTVQKIVRHKPRKSEFNKDAKKSNKKY